MLSIVKGAGGSGADSCLISDLRSELVVLRKRCDDSENRLRRSNLLFYGLPEVVNETWQRSEEIVTQFCKDSLGSEILASSIERAHRIGRHVSNQPRPIIVKFSHFKVKDALLSCGYKLKGSQFAIGEDFSLSVRTARKKLLEFARSQNKPYKLRFDKLTIEGKQYIYDSVQCVIKLQVLSG